MIKKIFYLLSIFTTLSFSKNITINDLIKYYQNGNYKKVCTKGITIFNKFKKDENLVTIYALSCLKSDYIDRLSVPSVVLKNSKSARANASYFLTILLQKKLLLNSLIDGVDISGLNLPQTDFIISKVFKLYTKKKYKKIDNIYIFEDIDGIKYKLYLEKEKKPFKMIILKIKDDIVLETHKYW